ncbi:MAG TPA: cyclopropane fatty acyl phospholipid synthase [Candidatus Sulfotelmatobacter sp.]|nr:cyclopropane fatty acyl phospholipid synthase [Candidatus Sulfotelmatobacter sp.]
MILKRNLRMKVEDTLGVADVRVNGGRPWDIVVHDDRFYARLISQGALGLGESYMDGWWDCADLAQLFCKLLKVRLDRGVALNWAVMLAYLKGKFANRQRVSRAASNAHRHYDLGNDLYQNMLGRWMLYSSANWEHAASLDEAGEAKMDFVCRRLNLRAGQKVLDIGCGWGGFPKYAAERCGVHVVGITLSTEQVNLARQICADLPVEIRYQDYRELNEKFDHVVSLGMFEHVGYKNYRRYMEIVRSCLKPDGLFYLNTIGANESGFCLNPWADKYIFPGAMLPSITQIGAAVDGIFVMQELRNWAEFYDRTLVAWFEKFHANWNKLKANYSERFYRMWKYYLLSSAGAFRAKAIQDWQIVLSC